MLVALLCLAYPFFEAYHLTVDRHTVSISGLPASMKNLKIAFVTDIHESDRYPQRMVDGLVRRINGLSADIVVLGGDYADSSADTIAFFRNLPKIQARLGVFGVLGDCDRSDPQTNYALVVKAMTAAGITPLTNSVAKVKLSDRYLSLAGVDDLFAGKPDVEAVASQLRQEDFVIFVAHNPDILPTAMKTNGADGDNHWFDIALFGHTHGGQVTLFGFPLLAQFVPDLGDRYLSGWLEENRAAILVSNGVGTEGFPARLFAPSQIHLMTLKPKTI